MSSYRFAILARYLKDQATLLQCTLAILSYQATESYKGSLSCQATLSYKANLAIKVSFKLYIKHNL